MSRGHVVVIGGGLAGISAALRCADNGFAVTLLEGRSGLGGATYSFRRAGLRVDTGQHVILRCYSAYTALLRRLGVTEGIEMQPRFRVPVLAPGGQTGVLARGDLPAPWHLIPALLGHRHLTLAQRAGVARTAWALRRLDPDDPELDRASFGAWLRAHGVPERSVRALWGLLCVAALNAPPEQASLALAVKVFRTGLLEATDSGDIGITRRSLGELHGTAGHRALVSAGVEVRTQCRARRVLRGERGLRVLTRERTGDSVLPADGVIVAVPHQAAATLLDGLPLPDRARWASLSAMPIVNVHVVYDRPVTERSLAAVVDSPVQWVFDRTRAAGLQQGQYLALSLSAAQDHVDVRTADLRERFLPALAAVFPAARRAAVRDFFVTRESRATFRQAPGTRALRPGARTAVPGLALAGAWTDTGWPDTTESAVRSGERAAEVLHQHQSESRRGEEVTA